LTFFVNANAQTKKKTEDWLLFNLNKYLSDDYDVYSDPLNKHEYSYSSYQFEIKEGKFIYTESFHHVTPAIKSPGTITEQIRTTIDLSKLIKVSQENSDPTPKKWPEAYHNDKKIIRYGFY